jgi:hypothetical protein
MRSTPPASERTPELVEQSSRVVYSLLKLVVRTAARFRLPIDRLIELTRLAYFEELRRQAPRDLDFVARSLGVSYRTAVNLNRAARADFFRPEKEIEPLRRVCAVLVGQALTRQALTEALDDLDDVTIDRALALLEDSGWITRDAEERYALGATLRSYVSDDLSRRIDGLNNHMEVLADSVWARFVEGAPETALGRTWVFVGRPEDVAAFARKTALAVRHDAVDVEETALKEGGKQRFGVTLAFAPIKED